MKHLLFFAMLLVSSLGLAQQQFKEGVNGEAIPVRAHGNAGSIGILTTVRGLDRIGVGAFESGFGARIYALPGVSLRGSIGGTITTGDSPSREINSTWAMLFDLTAGHGSNLYLGPTVGYIHSGVDVDSYKYGIVVGAELYGLITDKLSIGAEWPVTITHTPVLNSTTWSWGQPNPEFILTLWM